MAKEGFWFKELKDKTTQDNYDHWDEIFEVFQIEKEKFARDCERVSKQAMINFEGLNGSCPTKKPQKEKTKVQKKKKKN
jgi:hypothetical protein